jgi:spermidine synthase
MAALSGAGSLAVELVWMRILSLSFGSTSLAAGAVVAALMLGMAIGSAWASGPAATPDRARAWLRGALTGLASAAVPSAPILSWLGYHSYWGAALAGLFMVLSSIPMGMVLPLLVGWSAAPTRGAGALYASNTLGSAAAVFGTGFLLLPRLGNERALWVAAALLAGLGLVPWAYRPGALPEGAGAEALPRPALSRPAWGILLTYLFSALAAMASEIGWIRSLVLSVGSSTYAYTIVLGVFIAGLGAGSALAARVLGPGSRWASVFGWIQLGLAGLCLGAMVLLGRLPGFFGSVLFDRVTSLATFAATATAASALAILPPALAIGACFPAALGWLGGHAGPARASGLLLSAATAGSMLGALLGSMVLIPGIGIQGTLAASLLVHSLLGSSVLSFVARHRIWPSLLAAVWVGAAILVPPWDVRVIQSGPYIYGSRGAAEPRKVLFARDDRVASVAVLESPDGNRLLRIDGKTDASMSYMDLVTQLLTAHVPLLVHGHPERIALVGLGSGMTLASCLKHDPRRVDLIEISPAVVAASRLFDPETGAPLGDPRVRLHVGDARGVIRNLEGKFDVILNEPSNLWIAGMSGLFTVEFYRSCRDRLSDGGLMGQWIHAYGMTDSAFRDAIATFLEVFPHVTLWEIVAAQNYILVGSTRPHLVDAEAIGRRMGNREIGTDLFRIDLGTVGGLFSDLVARGEDLLPVLRGARVQTDDGMHLEFSAPLGFYGRRGMPALEVLPPVPEESLRAVVRGRPVQWGPARALVRRGIQETLAGRPRSATIGLFAEALRRFPEERQARLVLEDQAELSLREGIRKARAGRFEEALAEFDLIPPESRYFAEAERRRPARPKK